MLENTENPSLGFLILLSCFGVFSISVLAWGNLLFRSYSRVHRALLAVAFALWVPPILSLFGWLNQSWVPIVFTLLPLPALYFYKKDSWKIPALNWPEKILAMGFAVLIFCRFFEASLLQPHGDPLYYNLLSVAKWRQAGRIMFLPELPLLYQASWWDYFYLWPSMFFQKPFHKGFIETQIFGQWLHFFFAFCGSLLLWNKILQQFSYPRLSRMVSGFAVAACASMWWGATLAKNDWGAIFLFLGGFSLLLSSHYFLGGIILGMTLAAKWTTVPLVVVLLLGFFIRDIKKALVLGVSIFLGALPIVLRNYLATGDPLFPIPLGNAGKEFLSETFLEYLRTYSPGFSERNWSAIFSIRWQIVYESPFIWLGLLALLVICYRKTKPGPALKLYILSLVGFVIFILISGHAAENRLYGPGLVILAGSGALLVTHFQKKYLTWAVMIIALSFSRIPTHMPIKFFQDFPPTVLTLNAGDLKEQMLKELPIDSSVVTSGDNELFYLSWFKISDVLNNPTLDQVIRKSSAIDESLRALQSLGYRYLLHTTRYDGHCWTGYCETLQTALPQHQELVVFRGKTGVLLDLNKLGPTRH